MCIYHAVSSLKIQVTKSGKPPDCSIFGIMYCICCGHKLHGHGWRLRYYIDVHGVAIRIWIHRKRCPECKMTYTILPKWVHIFKIYCVETIRNVLEAAARTGHLGNHQPVSRPLQRIWKRQFVQRACIENNTNTSESLLQKLAATPSNYLAAPLSIRVLTKPLSGKLGLRFYRKPGSHQRLLLLMSSSLL